MGVCVSDSEVDSAYTLLKLPASTYASFEVYVTGDYDSENDAMDEWLEANKESPITETVLSLDPGVMQTRTIARCKEKRRGGSDDKQ